MGKQTNISLLLFLLLSPLFLFSQNFIIYSELSDETYVFDDQDINSQHRSISNYFLHQIALGNTSTSTGFSYSFDFQINKNVYRQNETHSVVKIEIVSKDCSGDVFYKGFNISDELKPSKVNFVVDIYSGNYIIATYSYSGIKINKKNVKAPDLTYENQKNSEDIFVKVRDIEFFYNDEDKDIFNKKIFLINDYYASESIIDSTLNYIASFDIKDNTKIFINLLRGLEVKQIERKLVSKNFFSQLNLQDYDPVNLSSKLYTLQLQLIRINTILELGINSEKKPAFLPKIRNLSNYYISRQLYYVDLSRKVNHFYTPAFYDLAFHKLTIRDVYSLSEVLTLFDDSKTSLFYARSKLKDFAIQLFDDYIITINYFLSDKRYNEAVGVLENAKELIKVVPGVGKPEILNTLISKAKHGIYNSYLKVANKALSINNKEMAEEYLINASDFQIKNSKYIESSEKVDRGYNKLAESYYQDGVDSNKTGNYKLAVENFSKATELSGTNMYDRFSKEIFRKRNEDKKGAYRNNSGNYEIADNKSHSRENIFTENEYAKKKLKYLNKCQSKIDESKSLFALEKFSEALEKLHEAENIKKQDQRINIEIDSLIERTASSLIMQKIYNAVMLIMDNKFLQAKELYYESLTFQKKYNFLKRQDIKNALKDLNDLIGDTKCKSLEYSYKNSISKADKAVENKQYHKAGKFLLEAITHANSSHECIISDSIAKSKYNYYLPAINYQNMMQEILDDLFALGLTSIIDRYRNLGVYYHEKEIIEYGLNHISFYEFLFGQNNSQLIIKTLDYFNESGQYSSSLDFLEVLFKQGFSESLVEEQQKYLGKVMAEKDFSSHPDNSIDENIPDNISENKWFINYYRSYRNVWRKKSIGAFFKSSDENQKNNNKFEN